MTVAHRAAALPVRTVYLPDLNPPRTDLALVDPAVAVATARRQEMKARILQDQGRKALQQARDLKVRRFWLGWGAATGTITTLFAAAVLLLTGFSLGTLGLGFVLGVGAVLVAHGCVFSLRHTHR